MLDSSIGIILSLTKQNEIASKVCMQIFQVIPTSNFHFK